MKQLLGITDRLPGLQWNASLDYLSERGLGFGTALEYETSQFFGLTGPTTGFLDAWGIDDRGLDNLGADRPALVPESDFRGRVLWQHRQRLTSGWQVTGQLGLISDRNFLNSFTSGSGISFLTS